LEVLEVFGYVFEEGAVIALRFLRSQLGDASGLKRADVELEEGQWRER
jgi:ATP-dependent Lon protease